MCPWICCPTCLDGGCCLNQACIADGQSCGNLQTRNQGQCCGLLGCN
jgi:hypothetical protein